MPLQNGEYVKLTQDEIYERLLNSLEAKLDADAQPGDLISKQLEAEAEVLAQNQEEALERVHQSAFLADANGEDLDKVVDVIGLSRQTATSATGVVRLWRDTPPTSNYSIPSGVTVQTSGSDPVQYETTEQNALTHIEGFEQNSLADWVGDTGSFNILNTTEMTGDYALEIPATSGVQITTTDEDYTIGTTFNTDIKPTGGSITAFRFGLQDQSNYFEVQLDEGAQDITLRLLEDGNEVTQSNNDTANIPAGESSHLEVTWGLYEDTEATLYSTESRDTELCSVTLSESREWESGAVSVASLDGGATALIDEIANRSVHVNIEAVDDGISTNIGRDKITTIGTPVSGVESVNNPIATGNPNLHDTTFSELILGDGRENDEELRERAFNSTSIGGSATVNALGTELRRIEGVQALTLKRNRENSEVNGLPAHSFEAIVYGGTDEEIGKAIFNSASIDSHDVGGINGSKSTYNIVSDVTKETETISWSRPVQLELSLELDLIVDENYVGDSEIQSIVANYIGGTDLDGTFVAGLDVGEDIYEAVLKRKIVGPDTTGVWEVNNLSIDSNNDGTDDTETTTSGAEVLAVANNEVATANARDGSITITTSNK